MTLPTGGIHFLDLDSWGSRRSSKQHVCKFAENLRVGSIVNTMKMMDKTDDKGASNRHCFNTRYAVQVFVFLRF